MRSAFFGLTIAQSAMNVARGNLHIHSHNVANVQTAGFSRQVADQRAAAPLPWSGGRGMVGSGSDIVGINQIRNSFLDTKFRNQASVLGRFSKKAGILELTQGILHEGVRVGITNEINDIFARIQDATTTAEDMVFRRNLLSSFESKIMFMQESFGQLRQQQIDLNHEISITVDQINSFGRQITTLNRQITNMELDGSRANDLRDQRNLLLDQLSSLVNIDVRETRNPTSGILEMTVLMDGVQFVNHFHVNQLELRPRQTATLTTGTAAPPQTHNNIHGLRNAEDANGLYDIFWNTGASFRMYSNTLSGQLRGLIDLRDGNGGSFPRLQNQTFTRGAAAGTTALPPGVGIGIPIPEGHRLSIDFAPGSRTDVPSTGVVTMNINGRNFDFRYVDFIPEIDADGVVVGGHFILANEDVQTVDNLTGSMTWTPGNATTGQTSSYSGIPAFKARLNELARVLTRAFNEGFLLNGQPILGPDGERIFGHIDGYDLNGNNDGIPLFGFTLPDGTFAWGGALPPHFNINDINVLNFAINPDILSHPDRFALADDPNSLPAGNQVLHSWLAIDDNRSLFREGRLGDFLAAITGEIGVVGRQAENFEMNHIELLVTIDNQRLSIKGVSMDEEMAMIMQHQLVFQAAARLVSIIDGIYDITINRMGSW